MARQRPRPTGLPPPVSQPNAAPSRVRDGRLVVTRNGRHGGMRARIRDYAAADAVPLAALYVRSVEHIGARDYSADQVAAWKSRAPSPERLHEMSTDGRATLVAVDESDRPIGFGDLERDGHINFLYCSLEAAGKGVAAALYAELERRARHLSIDRVYAEASEAARRFFLKQGFVVTATRRFEISGTEIHNYAMEKTLSVG